MTGQQGPTVVETIAALRDVADQQDGWTKLGDICEASVDHLTRLQADLVRAEARAADLAEALTYVFDCFEAAESEGLTNRLIEAGNEAGSLSDLIQRRLLFAKQRALEALANRKEKS